MPTPNGLNPTFKGPVESKEGFTVNGVVVGGTGDVSKVGAPASAQIGVWTGNGTLKGAEDFKYDGTNLEVTGAMQLAGVDGVDINPGSDVDAELITVGVTGGPTLKWNESSNVFDFNKGLEVSTTTAGADSLGPLKINRFRDDTVLSEDVTGTDYTNFEAQLRITDESGGYTLSDSGLAGGSAALGGFASVEATATVEKLSGVTGVVFQEDAGATVENGFGSYAGIIVTSGSNVTNAHLYGGLAVNGGGNITNFWGIKLPDIDGGSTINRAIETGAGEVLFGDQVTVDSDTFIITTAKTPASASATGTTGQIAWDAGYLYVCTATNTWERASIATW
jgi:hypothetical protein